jgi:hypothetical protein
MPYFLKYVVIPNSGFNLLRLSIEYVDCFNCQLRKVTGKYEIPEAKLPSQFEWFEGDFSRCS